MSTPFGNARMIISSPATHSPASRCGPPIAIRPARPAIAAFCLVTILTGLARSLPAQDDDPADPPSAEDCLQVAREFEELIQTGRSARATQLIDWESIIASATSGYEETPQLMSARRGFKSGFASRMRESGGLTAQIVATVEAGGGYRLLRMHEVDGNTRALFRLLLPQGGGVNYHDLEFHRDQRGVVRIRDMHIALSGEFFSQTLRRAFLPLAAEVLGEEDIGQANSEYLGHLDELTSMAEATQAREFEKALRIYAELPASMQQDKNVLFLRLQASQNANDEAYAETIADFSKFHPDDLCIELLSINGYILSGQHEQSLAAVNRIEQRIGGDLFLLVLRAGILFDAGSLDEAEQSAREAIELEPTLENAYWQVISVSLEQNDFATTAEMLTLIEDRLGIELADLTEVPEYAEFVKSAEFRKWIRERQ